MKVVANGRYTGFNLSEQAKKEYFKLKGVNENVYDDMRISDWNLFDFDQVARNDEYLVQVVERLKGNSWGEKSELYVVEIPDNANWVIIYCDGFEDVYHSYNEINLDKIIDYGECTLEEVTYRVLNDIEKTKINKYNTELPKVQVGDIVTYEDLFIGKSEDDLEYSYGKGFVGFNINDEYSVKYRFTMTSKTNECFILGVDLVRR